VLISVKWGVADVSYIFHLTKENFFRSKHLTKSPAQTKKVGTILAKRILNSHFQKEKAIILGLEGDLGGGKTTFLQGFARGLEIRERILSPTFVLMKKLKIPAKTCGLKSRTFIHIDCYRVKNPREILALGFSKMASDPKNIIAIEWAEKISKILSEDAIWIKFVIINKNMRKITFLIRPIVVNPHTNRVLRSAQGK